MTKDKFRTDHSLETERRNLSLYEEYNRLISEPGVSKTKVEEYLCKKHGLHSRSTIWAIRKRVAESMTAQEGVI